MATLLEQATSNPSVTSVRKVARHRVRKGRLRFLKMGRRLNILPHGTMAERKPKGMIFPAIVARILPLLFLTAR